MKPSLDRTFKIAIIISFVLAILYLGSSIIAPLVLSALLSIVILPLCKFLEKNSFNRFFGTLIPVVLVVGLVIIVGYLSIVQLKQLGSQLPNLESTLVEKTNNLFAFFPSSLRPREITEFVEIKNLLANQTWVKNAFGNALIATGEGLSILFLLPIYIFLIIFYRARFYEFIISIDKKTKIELARITDESQHVVQMYLSGLGLVILIIAVLASTGLWVLGIKYALLLGLISAVLTIIPYIGTFLGALLPILFAIATKDSVFYALGVAALFIIIQLLENNFITPIIVGRSVNINPLAAIIALLVAGQFWGIIGLIIAIPLAGILQIVLEAAPSLRHLAILLRND